MKHFVSSIIAFSFVSSVVLGKGNNDSPPPPPPPVHHSASTPVAPIGGSVPHNYSAPFRPVTTTVGNGQHTLVYPSVRNSIVQRSPSSNLAKIHPASLQHGAKTPSQSAVAAFNKTKLDPQTSARLRHWTGNVSSTAQARLNCHHHHDHDWWKHHCVTFIFFDWGWWGWYDGWWYPAWGYDASSNYEYNEPIYGNGDLSPDQIVAGVQTKLQQLGYYTYAIDGKMGAQTRSAIARFQRDHRMNITSGIDPETLGALGIIH